jgi:DHA1 family bicyclomycin/chloramphenicol resistance-like MFS transporter
VRRYVELGRDRRFRFVLLVSAMVWAGLFAYLSASPFLLQTTYALSPQLYGVVFAGNALLSVAAGQTTSRLVLPRIGPERMLGFSTALMVAGALVLAVGALTGGAVGWVLVGFPVFLIGTGTALPSAQLLGLRDHPEAAGTAVSLLGAANFTAAGLVSPLAGAIGAGAVLPLAAVLGTAGVLGVAGAALLRRAHGAAGEREQPA